MTPAISKQDSLRHFVRRTYLRIDFPSREIVLLRHSNNVNRRSVRARSSTRITNRLLYHKLIVPHILQERSPIYVRIEDVYMHNANRGIARTETENCSYLGVARRVKRASERISSPVIIPSREIINAESNN